jgi:glycosyltransferase involved in cell wall biosynthesis
MRVPRVVHVTTTPDFVRHIMIHDLRRLRPRTDATVVCADGMALADVQKEGFRVVTIPIQRKLSPVADLRTLVRLYRLLRRERPDLVHTYVPKGGLLGQMAAWLARIPHRIHSCRGLLYTPDLASWRRALLRSTDRLTNRLAQRTIYISRADRDFSVRERLCPERRARYTGSGVDLAHFDPAALPAETRTVVRHELGIPDSARLALTVGRFVVDKGYRELAEAASAVANRRPECRFLWVAPVLAGEEGALPDDFIAARGLSAVVTRLLLQHDVRRLYAASDLLVHPSYREGVPRVLMEAAAMGLPIIASDIPGCREVVDHGSSGLLVPPRSAESIASAIEALLADGAAAARMALAARRTVERRFDQDQLTERIWGVYRELLGE